MSTEKGNVNKTEWLFSILWLTKERLFDIMYINEQVFLRRPHICQN